ncbi:MAG: S8 family serine peptidase [Bacteroidales bacterium]|nr:S8 family serine peptidase [Bacteroidales bacterium]
MVSGILMLASCWQAQAQTQVAPDRYRVEFTDKNHNAYTVGLPQYFLSERALQRRARQGIAVKQADLPVSACYIDSLKQMGFEVLNTSRWLNSATVRCSPEDIEKLENTGFVKYTPVTPKKSVQDTVSDKGSDLEALFSFLFQKKNSEEIKPKYAAPVAYYGQAADQVGMMNGQALHNRGFRGKGMLIAVIDGGFDKAGELPGFDSLHRTGRLREIKNFTPDTNDIWGKNNHGTNVLSIISTNLPGRMMGSAPDAEYVLLRSEEVGKEYLVEEDNWIAAVEYADSIGADLITSSLGYTVFDDISQNHCHSELDGRTARASQAATLAAARGMIVCVSAGNDGDTPWKRISIPADADSVLTIGAVDRKGRYASFSSAGHTADMRIKPDLTAMGKETAYQNSMGNISTGNGTSYSTPLLAGLIACLWQACPDKGNMEIIDMVKRSADHFQQPDSLYGYGIPDFSKMKPVKPGTKNKPYTLSVHPDPVTGAFTVYLSPARHEHINIRIKTPSGQQVFFHAGYISEFNGYELPVDKSIDFTAGMYMVEARTDAGKVTVKAVR